MLHGFVLDLALWRNRKAVIGMRRIMMSALAAMVAVLAFGAMGAGSASAFHPLFFNGNGASELLFTGEGGLAVLRGLNASILGTIDCEKSLVHGFTLNKSTLARLVIFTFEGKCLQTIGSTVTKCAEPPIETKLTSVELGLSLSKAVLELVAPESGSEFVTITCGSNVTTTEGAVIGEIPAENGNKEAQLNSQQPELLTVFASEKANENQKYTSIELLGSFMTKVELKVSGFFGGKASEEAHGTTKADAHGTVEVSTK